MTLRFIHFGVGDDYYCDIELFRQLREFKDGITFLEGSVNLIASIIEKHPILLSEKD